MRCPNCFSISDYSYRCNACDFDAQVGRDTFFLPVGTALKNGEYIVGRVLGKPGGFGIAYLGWDTNLETKVAIKEYLPRHIAGRKNNGITVCGHTADDRADFEYGLERFMKEAQILARFRHPNVVRAISFFRENGTAYLLMDYLEGESLHEYVSRVGRLTGPDAVQLLLPMLDGLAQIHMQGFIHRDIKPANIFLTERGEPVLLDFGAARQALGERSQSLSVVVTPGFAPWEQYSKRGRQGPWTDVYACAATLYFMLTGVVPQEGWERVKFDELEPVGNLVAGLDAAVADTINRGLAVNVEERPQTAVEFKKVLTAGNDKLEKEIAAENCIGHIIQLWDVKSGRELWRIPGHRCFFNPNGKLLICCSEDETISVWDVGSARKLWQKDGHKLCPNNSTFSSDGAVIYSFYSDAIWGWDLLSGRESLHTDIQCEYKQRNLSISPDGKFFVVLAKNVIQMWDAMNGRELWRKTGYQYDCNTNDEHNAVFSPDGKKLARINDDSTIRMWDVLSGQELWQKPEQKYYAGKFAFSPDGKIVASSNCTENIMLWDVTSGRELQKLRHSDTAVSFAFSTDGKMLASESGEHFIWLWNVERGQLVRQLSHENFVRYGHGIVDFSADGKKLVFRTGRGIVLWDVFSGREIWRKLWDASFRRIHALSPDGMRLVSSHRGSTIRIWDMASAQEMHRLPRHVGRLESAALSQDGKILATEGYEFDQSVQFLRVDGEVVFSPDRKTLASLGEDGTIHIWDVTSASVVKQMTGSNAFAFSPDGKILAGFDYYTICLWDVESGSKLWELIGHTGGVSSLAFSPDGKTLASGSEDTTIRLWDIESGRELHRMNGYNERDPLQDYAIHVYNKVVFSPDGKTLISEGAYNAVRLWDVSSGRKLLELNESSLSYILSSIIFSPDGKMVVIYHQLWDVASWRVILQFKDNHNSRLDFKFSPDGTLLAVGDRDTIQLWDVDRFEELQQLSGHTAEISSFAFSPDGKMLVTEGLDKTIRLWDIASGQTLWKKPWDQYWRMNAAFSPNGRLLIGKSEKILQLLDVANGRKVRQLGETEILTGIYPGDGNYKFSPDGNTVASRSNDSIRLMNIASGESRQLICGGDFDFSLDGKTLIIQSENCIVLWNVADAMSR